MNLVIISCLLLFQPLIAVELNTPQSGNYQSGALSYDIVWRPDWGFGLLKTTIAQANFYCDIVDRYCLARADLQSTGLIGATYPFRNQVSVAFDSTNALLWSKSRFTDSTRIEWEVDRYRANLYVNDTLYQILPLQGKRPLDALSAFYLFRGMPLDVGQLTELEVIGINDSGRVRWDKASIEVLRFESLKFQRQRRLCWVIEITLPALANIMPSGSMLVWLTTDDQRLPLKVETDVLYKSVRFPLVGILNPPKDLQKDEP